MEIRTKKQDPLREILVNFYMRAEFLLKTESGYLRDAEVT